MMNIRPFWTILLLTNIVVINSCSNNVGPLERVGKWQLGTQTFMEFYYLDHSISETELKNFVKDVGSELKKKNTGLEEVGVLVLYDKKIAMLVSSTTMMNSVLKSRKFEHNQFFKHPN